MMTPEHHTEFLNMLDEALASAIRRYRALHHASLAELHEMQREVEKAREALAQALKQSAPSLSDADCQEEQPAVAASGASR
ncbi:MAG: hypothetical protein ACOY99_00995 [Pseudomonadota bacterium]